MSNQPTTDLKTLLPWLYLLKTVPISLGLRMLLLGTIGWLTYSAGYVGLSYLPFAPTTDVSIPIELKDNLPSQLPKGVIVDGDDTSKSARLGFTAIPDKPTEFFSASQINDTLGHVPLVTIWLPLGRLLSPGRSWAAVGWDWTILLWALVNWSLFGGAICRLAALQFGKQQRKSIGYALRFSRRQWLAYLIAPFVPLTGLLCVGSVNSLLGFIASWNTSLSQILFTVITGFCLFLGLLMALLTIGLMVGWPLMIAAISTEDSDGFDGLSRSFGFLTDRPFHAVGMSILCFFMLFPCGSVVLMGFLRLIKHLAGSSIAVGLGVEGTQQIGLLTAANATGSWWISAIDLFKGGFGPSFFFTSITIIYFLLRLSDDGTPLTTVVDSRDHELSKKQPAAVADAATPEAQAAAPAASTTPSTTTPASGPTEPTAGGTTS